jgi:hypothetical protein
MNASAPPRRSQQQRGGQLLDTGEEHQRGTGPDAGADPVRAKRALGELPDLEILYGEPSKAISRRPCH